MHTVRILISSPGDVAEERDQARQIIRQLQKRYSGQLQLAPVLWEDLPLGLDSSFQEGIDVILSAGQGIDIAVFIIWSRLGSMVGREILRPDGSVYRSGTERELDLMLAARKASGGVRPALLGYVREDAQGFQDRFRGQPTDVIRQIIEQKQTAEEFIREQFQDASTGTNVRAYATYDKPIQYAHRLRTHLQGLLDDLVQRQPGVVRWEGSPFRGLEVFDLEHASIFFGRETEVTDVLLALHERAATGCGAVVIAGASGSGKSSLVRAGVVPALVEQNLDNTTARWRYLIYRPGTSASNLLLGLAQELCTAAALPELQSRLQGTGELAAALGRDVNSVFELTLRPALRAFDEADQPARLLIVIDQLEELFTHAGGQREEIQQFFHVLLLLARTDRICVIATVRSDFYAQCQEYEDFLALKHGPGLYDLLPPRPAALLQMITRPAALAGLRFEDDPATRESFDRRILDDASEQPDALPLLQYSLRELFERRTAEGVLTLAAYQALGGVVGALSRRAEQVFLSLSVEAQQTLGNVLNELVTVSETDSAAVARQRSPLAELTELLPQRELVQRFIHERLLVSDRGIKDQPVVSVAHESLLRAWTRAAAWIDTNRQFLAARARVQQDLERWRREGRSDDFLIASGKPLEDARALLSVGRNRLGPDQREYVERSSAFQLRRQQRQLRRSRIATAVFLVLALLAGAVGFVAVRAQRSTTHLNSQLEEQLYENRIAVAERELSMNNDVDLAGDLLDLCPAALRGWEWHYLMALRDGPRASLIGHTKGLWTAAFSPDGRQAVTASIDGSAKIWDVDTGKLLHSFDEHDAMVLGFRRFLPMVDFPDVPVKAAVYSPDGRYIASGSITPRPLPNPDIPHSPGTVLIWEAATRKVVRTFNDQLGIVLSLTYSPDGRYIASSSMNAAHTFVVWEAATGRVVKVVSGHTGHVYTLCYSPDGHRILSGGIDGTIKVWDASTLQLLGSIVAHPAPVMSVAFAPDGTEFVSAGQDGTLRIWNATTLKLRAVLRGHTGSALCAAYTPDGTRIASGGFDKTVRLWDPKTGRLKITLRLHKDSVWSVAFSRDGRRLISASYDNTAYIWDTTPRPAPEGEGIFSLTGHKDRVNRVAFSPDGRLLASASWDKTIHLWDAHTGAPLSVLSGHDGAVWGIAFSADSGRLVSAGWDQTVRVWNVATAQQIACFAQNDAPVHDVAFTPDGRRVISSSWNGSVTVWDLGTAKAVMTLPVSLFPVLGIDVSHDGTRVACVGGDHDISIWSLQTGAKVLTIANAHTAAVYGVAFSPDGKQLVSGGWDGYVKLWDLDPGRSGTGQRPRVVNLFSDVDHRIYGVAFSRDGTRIASTSDDKQVRIWSAATGQQVGEPLVHRGVVWDVAFSPDSHRVASAAWTKSAWVRTWPVQ